MTADEIIPEPPPGFVRSSGRGQFSTVNGPYFHKPAADTDGLLASAVGFGTGKGGVTIHLSIDVLHMARQGDWVIGEARMTRATKDVAFSEGVLRARGVDVVRASGLFKLMDRRG